VLPPSCFATCCSCQTKFYCHHHCYCCWCTRTEQDGMATCSGVVSKRHASQQTTGNAANFDAALALLARAG
jgi:hypothetical protein